MCFIDIKTFKTMQTLKLKKSIVKAFLFCSIVALFSSFTMRCSFGDQIQGNGNIVKKTVAVNGFNSVSVNDAIRVQIIQSQSSKVIVESDSNLLNYIDVNVASGGKLVIKRKNIKQSIRFSKLIVYVYTPKLSSIEVNDACSMNIDKFKSNNLQVVINDASQLQGNLECESLAIKLQDASKLILSGKAQSCDFDINDASSMEAQNMVVNNATIKLNDASSATINVVDMLSCDVIDASHLSYKGNPKINKRHVGDASKVQRID